MYHPINEATSDMTTNSSSSAFSSPISYKRPRVTSAPKQASTSNLGPSRPIHNEAIFSLEEIYRNGRRCAIIDRSLKQRKWRMASFRATILVAETIFDHWEGDADGVKCAELRSRKQQFANYVVGFVMRIGPSVVTLLHALQYTIRLRAIYPRARGEKGCAHRLFVVSLLVASKYLQDQQLLIKPSHATWSTLSGVFTASELQRMELEFVTFLRGNLYIGLSELDQCTEDIFFADDDEMGRAVPGSIDWLELISIKAKPIDVHPSDISVDSRVP